jgi:hypothetical protein
MTVERVQRCQHTLEDGIHYFTVFDYSRAGTDDFINAVLAMYVSPDVGMPVMVDSSRGTLPLGYMVGRFRDLYRNTPKPQKSFKIAVLYQPAMIVGMVDGMIRLFSYTQVRLFKGQERDKALDWLRKK